ncbi:alpha/beta hydrolase [Gordonia hankookensis]
MTTDSGSWWAVGPALAARGYRVVAPDLPGPRRQPT